MPRCRRRREAADQQDGGARATDVTIGIALTILAALSVTTICEAAGASGRELRVCADPNNLPFSNQQEEGFENRIAELVADELDAELSYTWWAQRRGFIRNTLAAGACDLVIGVSAGYELAETTDGYYRSTYVYVYRADRSLDLSSMRDPRLRELKVGVHLIGDDGVNPPPAHALSEQGIIDNVVGYMIYGDYREPNPLGRIVAAVASGDLDLAAVGGPIGGYFAKHASVPLVAVPIADTAGFSPLRFEFGIAMGVRKGEHAFREELNGVLARRREDINRLLDATRRVETPLEGETWRGGERKGEALPSTTRSQCRAWTLPPCPCCPPLASAGTDSHGRMDQPKHRFNYNWLTVA